MHALVLAVCPGPISGYAVVHGNHVYEAGHWALAGEIRTMGPTATPAEVVARLMDRRLCDEVEHTALRYPLDAVVIERRKPGLAGEIGNPLHPAGERAALLAKRDYRLVDEGSWDASADASLDGGSPSGEETADTLARCRRLDPGPEAARRAVLLGRHASMRMGIYPVDAMPDYPPGAGEWA
ncbi:hypothetical protein [Antarcticirhabdus aurantiaca]|uniref:Uncharacterized protein n=1 Tax=Antarcticirhabdus aurantiaca TaxID=2606717 RepID=A0ACD4NNE6_9HYPH|nr:hypothetical protein [Antarcticirhabdus aurantiaca]WAJ28450.1 hypothetical protein OXU80_27190 [Jeongeuplla avenae]